MEGTSQARVEVQADGREIRLAGAAAGALGSVAMMAFMAAAAALDGSSPLDPIAAVGTAFRGEDASRTGLLAATWGVVIHLSVGALLGVVFAAIVPRDMPLSCSIVLGAGSALFWMAFAVAVLIPRLAPVLDVEMPRQGGAWVLAYALFGAVTGFAPALRRAIGRRTARRAEGPRVLRPRTTP